VRPGRPDVDTDNAAHRSKGIHPFKNFNHQNIHSPAEFLPAVFDGLSQRVTFLSFGNSEKNLSKLKMVAAEDHHPTVVKMIF